MPSFNEWGAVLTAPLREIWYRFVDLAPNIVAAVVVFIIAVIIAQALGRVIATVLGKLYVDHAVEATGLKKMLERIGFKLTVSDALGLLVTWFLYAVALVAAADILGLPQISEFLRAVVLYIPNVIIAVVILLVGVIVSNFVHTLVKETASAGGIEVADTLANVAKWAILTFTVMAALIQLGVARELIQILFTGLVLMISLAGGIAFGMGGQGHAKQFLDKLTNKR